MGMCHKCSGVVKLVTGALLLLNAFVWPKWGVEWAGTGWIAWLGVLMVLFGVVKVAVPNKCKSCNAGPASVAKSKK